MTIIGSSSVHCLAGLLCYKQTHSLILAQQNVLQRNCDITMVKWHWYYSNQPTQEKKRVIPGQL